MRRPARVGRITARWSHLLADTSDELREFAAKLGLRPEWIQRPGTPHEHYDVTDTVRTRALQLGAEPMSYRRETGRYIASKRRGRKGSRAGRTRGTGAQRRSDMRREQIFVGQRVELVLSVRLPPSYKRTRDAWVEGTVQRVDEDQMPPGVRVQLDKPVNGVVDCYATYDELSPAWAQR